MGRLAIYYKHNRLDAIAEYAERQIPMLFMGVGFFFGGIYLVNRAKEKKIEEEKRKREKEEWLGHR